MSETTNVSEMLAGREQRYGSFINHARISQDLKRVLHERSGWDALAHDQREALEMICHKIARIMNGDPTYHDNWLDIAGYATLVADRLERQASNTKD